MSTQRKIVIGIDASRANVAKRTGVEWYAFYLIQELKQLIPDSYQVVLYSREPLTYGLEKFPAHWESRVLAWPPKFLWTQMRLSFEMLIHPPDILFSPVHVLPLLLPKHAIVTVHDVAFMARREAYGFFGMLYLMLMTWYATWRAHILTVSEFSKSEIVKFFGADPMRMTTTPLGFDTSTFGHVSKETIVTVTRRHEIIDPYFLFVGRLEKKKNLAGLLRAFRIFKEQHDANDSYRLVLIGKRGRGYDEAMQEIAGSEVGASVRELGYVAQEDIPALYAGATAFVFPSFYEGFGLPVLEAFASGTPVITSHATSLPEVAGNGALYVDPAAPQAIAGAMRRLIADHGLREWLISCGRARANAFTWRATAEKTWEALVKAAE